MYPDNSLLRRSLMLHAGFSAASAAVLAFGAGPVGGALGSVPPMFLFGLAAMLAAFAFDLFRIARSEPVNPLRAAAVTGADLLWVAASAALLVFRPDVLSRTGLGIVGVVALVVLGLASLQALGLGRYARNGRGETDEVSMFSLTLDLDAPPDRIWALVQSLERIGEFYDLLASVEVEEEAGCTVRTCEDRKGRRWSEEVLEMDDEARSLTVRFVSEADDFPFPMTSMVGGWRVAEASGAGSRLTLWYEYTMPGGPLGEITAALTGPVLEERMTPVIRKMEATAEPGGVRDG